jgi:hypothetical protein
MSLSVPRSSVTFTFSCARAISSAEIPFAMPDNSSTNALSDSAVLSACAAAATMNCVADLRMSKPDRTPAV